MENSQLTRREAMQLVAASAMVAASPVLVVEGESLEPLVELAKRLPEPQKMVSVPCFVWDSLGGGGLHHMLVPEDKYDELVKQCGQMIGDIKTHDLAINGIAIRYDREDL